MILGVCLVQRLKTTFSGSSGARVDRQIGCDASPQVGLELLSGGYDTITNCDMSTLIRTEFPTTSLGHGHLSLKDRSFSMLWAVWLLVGPSMAALYAFCNTVTQVLTDWGTESGLQDVPDIIPAFIEFICTGAMTLVASPQSRLFPRNIFVPDWNHIWDGMSAASLKQLDWFAAWLALLKQVVRWFRVAAY